VAAAFGPGAGVGDVARQADVTPSLIYRWRGDLRAAANGLARCLWRRAGEALHDRAPFGPCQTKTDPRYALSASGLPLAPGPETNRWCNTIFSAPGPDAPNLVRNAG
jgi:Transposase